ncbi:aminopeptidase N [Oceanobacter sp. 4_MG-2023]|jgi:aminopeptidase N|uniref:aminopeptidase N n=1 Tax=Oceanobacter sp. 4_MG-2023 TaxID=3062623 RepID=UPI0027371313|nr:aminopeptidase N [Oceanobacter sp. 4_MG-2023]MDP2546236.1 aminopeptidase N [Oceanobacter sp. 4_MG-2023]
MRDAQPQSIYLKDYCQPEYWINQTELTFELQEDATVVTAVLTLEANNAGNQSGVLELQGQQLELLQLTLDGTTLAADAYTVTDDSLTITGLAQQHQLSIVTRIDPAANTALEGLYRSGGMYCTQCEAEGFRRITYYLDRPDVMSVFTTHIIADGERYPVMLSNGNCIADETLADGRRQVSWLDPHRKPAYLFALVAGDLLHKEDHFTTMSGRDVTLRIFVEPQNIDKTEYALDALKRSMRWDEEVYGREYDLDIFMIVAVDDFNMGAMENKGLNVFNSSCVLANPATATDAAYQRIEAIVAHEYFHNWSGNRVTCRDWFQLSLKEGFTVFRDASFSADMHSATVKRIEDARMVRTVQFAEDGGPMAHPVQPDSFIEIANFYTVTIYEKGAEVVGMIHKILGADGFRKGSDLYFERHDGQAVTIHDFVAAMEDANGIDLTLFKRWYKQAGTPVVSAEVDYRADEQALYLTLRQQCPDTPGQTNKQPMWIPVQLGLLDANGQDLPVQVTPSVNAAGMETWTAASQVLHLTEAEQTFVFSGLESQPVLSLFRDFSAPVKVEFEQSAQDLLFRLQHDSDGFNRWDAGQRLMLGWIDQARLDEFELPEDARQVMAELLSDDTLDPAMVSYLLTLPSEAYIAEFSDQVDPHAIHLGRQRVRLAMAMALNEQFAACYQRLLSHAEYQPEPQQMAARTLKNLALSYWSVASDAGVRQALAQFGSSDNMTDQMAALQALICSGDDELAQQSLEAFYQQWQNDALVVNQWLSVQAGSADLGTLSRIQQLLEHEAFDWRNPNKIRSVIGAFANQALCHFHAQDGSGYRLLADAVIRLNATNPQIASRLLTPLTKWRRLVPALSEQMKEQLERVAAQPDLSRDVYEIVSKSLA